MDPRLKLLSLWQPEGAIPTKLRRMRRVSFNIESNGSRRCRCQRPLIEPYYSAHSLCNNSSIYDKYLDSNFCYDCKCFRARQEAGLSNSNSNYTHQEAINELKYVLARLESQQQVDGKFFCSSYGQPAGNQDAVGMDSYKSFESSPTTANNSSLEYTNQSHTSRIDAQLNRLTDLVHQTMFKLDKFIEFQAEQKHQKFKSSLTPKEKSKPAVQILPLVVMPQTNSASPEAIKSERMRNNLAPCKKRSTAGRTHASNNQEKRDCGTTMWCPYNCCGTITESMTRLPSKECQANVLPARMKTPTIESSQEQSDALSQNQSSVKDLVDVICNCLNAEKQRPNAGYCVEEEIQTDNESNPEADVSSIDDWFTNAQNSLANLETQEKYYSNSLPILKPCLVRTESRNPKVFENNCPRPNRSASTFDKSVSNSDMQQKNPVQIVNIYKTTAQKTRNAKRKVTKKKASDTFVNELQEQLELELNRGAATKKSIMDGTSESSRVFCACDSSGGNEHWPETEPHVAVQPNPIASCCKNCRQQQFAMDSTAAYDDSEPRVPASSWDVPQDRGNYFEAEANSSWHQSECDSQQVNQSNESYSNEEIPGSYPDYQWDGSRVAACIESCTCPNSVPDYYYPPNQTTGAAVPQQPHQPSILVIVVNNKPSAEEHQKNYPDAVRKPRRHKKVKRRDSKKLERKESHGDQDKPEEVCDCENENILGDLEKTLESIIPGKDCLCYLQSLANKKQLNSETKKKPTPKPAFDRFASPPFVIEPKPCCRSYCNRNYCYSHCNGCCTNCYPWC